MYHSCGQWTLCGRRVLRFSTFPTCLTFFLHTHTVCDVFCLSTNFMFIKCLHGFSPYKMSSRWLPGIRECIRKHLHGLWKGTDFFGILLLRDKVSCWYVYYVIIQLLQNVMFSTHVFQNIIIIIYNIVLLYATDVPRIGFELNRRLYFKLLLFGFTVLIK